MNDYREIFDVVIVGAGPAGLSAAVYLGRYRRRCLLLHDNQSRARWIPTSHNIPGFTAGIGGQEFLDTMTAQARKYGASIRSNHVSKLSSDGELFHFDTDGERIYSRYVIIATGVRDRLPAIQGASEALLRSVLRVCPICDAYEAIDKRIGVISDGALGEREAQFLRNYSDDVTLLHIGAPPSDATPGNGGADGIKRMSIELADLRVEERQVSIATATGVCHFDVLYLALGCHPQHDLARGLDARCDEHGTLEVNAHQETSVRGMYAAGDVVRGLNQVVVAAAESAIAATDIHNKLRAR